MITVFADTFYFLALLHKNDEAHDRAVALSKKLTSPIVTTAWVLTEVADALSAPGFRAQFVQLYAALRADSQCTIIPPSASIFEAGVALYAERPDKSWTLTDCISFVVMRKHAVTEALTGDRHFEQAGFIALLL